MNNEHNILSYYNGVSSKCLLNLKTVCGVTKRDILMPLLLNLFYPHIGDIKNK